jgi:uncharacterized protein (TIGR02118 family)
MVKLICFLKRKPGMSAEDFHTYWREQHGPLVASTKSGGHALRYEQNHRVREHWDQDGYDGVTEQWFSSTEDFFASLREDDYKLIEEDMPRFLDTDQLVWMITEEPEVVVDRVRNQ